jgi:hypothetical protein
MVDMDDLPDETGGSQPAQKPAQSKPAARTNDLPDDLPDEGGVTTTKGATPRDVERDWSGEDNGPHPEYSPAASRRVTDDYPDKNLIEDGLDDPTEEQLAGADYYVTLEGVEKELSMIADSLEIGAWEGQDEELRTQIKCLQAIRLTLNNTINRS